MFINFFVVKYFIFQFNFYNFYVKFATLPHPPKKVTPIFPNKPPIFGRRLNLSRRKGDALYDWSNSSYRSTWAFLVLIKVKSSF